MQTSFILLVSCFQCFNLYEKFSIFQRPLYKVTLLCMLGTYQEAHQDLEEIIVTATLQRLKLSLEVKHLRKYLCSYFHNAVVRFFFF